MTEYRQQTARRQNREPDEQEVRAEDLRNEELDEDVACCLAEIDDLLTEEESERDRAIREFDGLDEKGMRVWNAKYAHLGLRVGESCCVLYLYDNNAGKMIKHR